MFGLCQLHCFVDYLRGRLSTDDFQTLFKATIITAITILGTVTGILTITGTISPKIQSFIFLQTTLSTGKVSPWTGRFYSLLDPSYAKNNIPIIASVSEHQPTSWSSFYFDLQLLVFLFPAGLYFCFRQLTDANIFLVLYGVTSIYFAVSILQF